MQPSVATVEFEEIVDEIVGARSESIEQATREEVTEKQAPESASIEDEAVRRSPPWYSVPRDWVCRPVTTEIPREEPVHGTEVKDLPRTGRVFRRSNCARASGSLSEFRKTHYYGSPTPIVPGATTGSSPFLDELRRAKATQGWDPEKDPIRTYGNAYDANREDSAPTVQKPVDVIFDVRIVENAPSSQGNHRVVDAFEESPAAIVITRGTECATTREYPEPLLGNLLGPMAAMILPPREKPTWELKDLQRSYAHGEAWYNPGVLYFIPKSWNGKMRGW